MLTAPVFPRLLAGDWLALTGPVAVELRPVGEPGALLRPANDEPDAVLARALDPLPLSTHACIGVKVD